MALLERRNLFQTDAPPSALPSAPLSAVERHTMMLARGDGRRSVDNPGRLVRAMRSMAGVAAPNRLADPRLEALRRYSVLYRLDGAGLELEEDDKLEESGFTLAQAATIRREVDRLAGAEMRSSRRDLRMPLAALLMLASTVAVMCWLAASLGDPLIACALGGLIMVTLIPLLPGRDTNAR